ncbi:hypothetical protein BSL78_27982 [Apostichopus japonicus]|uniref:Uncharacterized protein n=1 Tax=Stichopus japonicus TaxID=307972 RepID=A0A2G8JHG8_STIJA|nr:hypothetical protein BSL78_27982 [Apostichopus japonicus]
MSDQTSDVVGNNRCSGSISGLLVPPTSVKHYCSFVYELNHTNNYKERTEEETVPGSVPPRRPSRSSNHAPAASILPRQGHQPSLVNREHTARRRPQWPVKEQTRESTSDRQPHRKTNSNKNRSKMSSSQNHKKRRNRKVVPREGLNEAVPAESNPRDQPRDGLAHAPTVVDNIRHTERRKPTSNNFEIPWVSSEKDGAHQGTGADPKARTSSSKEQVERRHR